MSVVYVLLPLALASATIWTLVFAWSVRRGQLDDLEGAAWRILGDDVAPTTPTLPTDAGQLANRGGGDRSNSGGLR